MEKSNFERMLDLADGVFASKNDPNQIDVNPAVLEHFQKIHKATVSEYDDGNGPVAWVLLLPTTSKVMNQFLEGKISELELFEQTPLNETYDSVYLCSAMVLKEYRRKGITRKLVLDSMEQIRKDHPIKYLFVWSFSKEGDLGAEALASLLSLPLLKKV
jgi:hypothetical protein